MNPNNIAKFEKNNIFLNVLSSAKDGAVKNQSEPHFSFGKIISKYCPDFGTKFDKDVHIPAVYPVATDGIFALAKFADLVKSHVIINELPMKHEEIAKFTTKEFLMENSTASSNGCHLIVSTKDLASSIMEDLRKHSFEPTVIGFVAKKERPYVVIEKDVSQYIASKAKLGKLNSVDRR
jgi:selenophosphate synthase